MNIETEDLNKGSISKEKEEDFVDFSEMDITSLFFQ